MEHSVCSATAVDIKFLIVAPNSYFYYVLVSKYEVCCVLCHWDCV